MKTLLEQIEEILDGIDRTEQHEGWWETSVGEEFGKTKLEEIRKLLKEQLQS